MTGRLRNSWPRGKAAKSRRISRRRRTKELPAASSLQRIRSNTRSKTGWIFQGATPRRPKRPNQRESSSLSLRGEAAQRATPRVLLREAISQRMPRSRNRARCQREATTNWRATGNRNRRRTLRPKKRRKRWDRNSTRRPTRNQSIRINPNWLTTGNRNRRKRQSLRQWTRWPTDRRIWARNPNSLRTENRNRRNLKILKML